MPHSSKPHRDEWDTPINNRNPPPTTRSETGNSPSASPSTCTFTPTPVHRTSSTSTTVNHGFLTPTRPSANQAGNETCAGPPSNCTCRNPSRNPASGVNPENNPPRSGTREAIIAAASVETHSDEPTNRYSTPNTGHLRVINKRAACP